MAKTVSRYLAEEGEGVVLAEGAPAVEVE